MISIMRGYKDYIPIIIIFIIHEHYKIIHLLLPKIFY